MIGGSLALKLAAGMFAQYLKLEVQYWILALLAALLAVLWEYSTRVVDHSPVIATASSDTGSEEE